MLFSHEATENTGEKRCVPCEMSGKTTHVSQIAPMKKEKSVQSVQSADGSSGKFGIPAARPPILQEA